MFNKKKQYFKRKLDSVVKTIWDLEFKREKTLTIREEIRQEYENQKAKLEVLQARIKSEKDEAERKKLDDNEALLTRDIERFEAQMKGLDLEVSGSKPTEEYRDGVQGINHQIDSLHELRMMLQQYIKTL